MVDFQPGLHVGFHFVNPKGNFTQRTIFQTFLSSFALTGKLRKLFIFLFNAKIY